MSLDIHLSKRVEDTDLNITHNLGHMTAQVILDEGKTSLYTVLWRPEEISVYYAEDIIPYLIEAVAILHKDRNRLQEFSPENGWGSYEGLLNFTVKYLHNCFKNKDARINVDR